MADAPNTLAPALAAAVQRAADMQFVGGYLSVLCEVIGDQLVEFRNALSGLPGGVATHAGEWRILETLVRLARDQADIVVSTGEALDDAHSSFLAGGKAVAHA